MDDTDRRLIGLLRENARLPVATLAQLLKVSRGTVQNRIPTVRKVRGPNFRSLPADRTAAPNAAPSTYRPLDGEIGCGDNA
jgi:hypothetical protein